MDRAYLPGARRAKKQTPETDFIQAARRLQALAWAADPDELEVHDGLQAAWDVLDLAAATLAAHGVEIDVLVHAVVKAAEGE